MNGRNRFSEDHDPFCVYLGNEKSVYFSSIVLDVWTLGGSGALRLEWDMLFLILNSVNSGLDS